MAPAPWLTAEDAAALAARDAPPEDKDDWRPEPALVDLLAALRAAGRLRAAASTDDLLAQLRAVPAAEVADVRAADDDARRFFGEAKGAHILDAVCRLTAGARAADADADNADAAV
jgi:hypothetical protein